METQTKTKRVYITRNDLFKDLNLVMCNNICQVDPNFIDYNTEIFYSTCEDCNGTGETRMEIDPNGTIDKSQKCDECYGEGQHDLEPYQYFLCDPSEWTIKDLKEYGVTLGYSELLDLYVLPIYDFGTGWDAFSYSKEVPEDYILDQNETLTRATVY